MSDFGSSVAVYRADGHPPSAEDERRVRAAAQAMQFARADRIGPYDGLELRFGAAQDGDGVEGLLVRLSGFVAGDEDGNDDLDPEVIIARESPIAEQFAWDLERALGSEYRAVAYSGYW
jgi:hypothetical protein